MTRDQSQIITLAVRSYMRTHGASQDLIATAIKRERSTISRRLTGKSLWRPADVRALKEAGIITVEFFQNLAIQSAKLARTVANA